MPPFSENAIKTNGFSLFFVFALSRCWLHFTSILSPKWVTCSFQNLTCSTFFALGSQTGPQGRPRHQNGTKKRAQGPQKTPKSHQKWRLWRLKWTQREATAPKRIQKTSQKVVHWITCNDNTPEIKCNDNTPEITCNDNTPEITCNDDTPK